MIRYTYDDGGRADAGYNGQSAGDCVSRALAILTNNDYKLVYLDLAHANKLKAGKRSARDGLLSKVWQPVYRDYDLVKVKLPPGARPTYSEAHEQYGDCIVSTAKHVAAIVDGNLRDVFDGRGYWWREDAADDPVWRERKAQSVWVKASWW